MRLIPALVVGLLLSACGKTEKKPEKEDPPAAIAALYQEASHRLASQFLENGWVVSRHADGSPEHMGEAGLWSWIAMGTMPCDISMPIADNTRKVITDGQGELVRYLPLGEYAGGREINFDGETGYYFGMALRGKHCPGERESLKAAWALRSSYIASLGGRLHRNIPDKMPDQFTFTRDAISHFYGLGGEPSTDRLRILEQQIAAWVAGVKATHSSCYRVHLGLRHFLTIEALGYKISDLGRSEFCAASQGMDIPLVDWWCGREVHYLEKFAYSQWEFRHQRCGAWEKPDGQGLQTPGLDLIDYLDNVYSLPH